VGSLQAVEALKWLLGIGSPLVGRLLHYDALTQQVRELEIAADPSCPACAPGRREHITYQDSDVACASRPAERP
jgi:sulfur-carrier protein adenylyltransferase/sulfurtransferase